MENSPSSPPEPEPVTAASRTSERSVGAYRLMSKLGQGGMSAVYLALNPEGHKVALKLLSFTLEDEPDFLQRFRREAALTRELDHPHIVKTLDFGEDPQGGIFLVMQYIEGFTLRQHLERKGIPSLERVGSWVQQIASALDYAHQRGVVHRDIKPENLLLESEEQIFVADFGVARVEEGTRLTRTGIMPGTPEYMSPELFGDHEATPASDIYSLALVVYELLSGCSPFRSDNVARIIQRQAFEIPRPVSAARLDHPQHRELPHLPPAVDEVLKRALEKDPARRPSSVEQFADQLLTALSDSPRERNEATTGVTPTSRSASPLEGPPSLRRPPGQPGGDSASSPTMMVAWTPPEAKKSSPWWWLIPLALMSFALWVNFAPREARLQERYWLEEAVGWNSVPLSGDLHGALMWHGLEIALYPPQRTQTGNLRARAAAAQFTSWLREGKLENPEEMRGELVDGRYLLSGPRALLTIDNEWAAEFGAKPGEVGEYWLALIRDLILMRAGTAPRYVKALERERPLRAASNQPRSPLLQMLFDKARLLKREGPLTSEGLADALLALSSEDRKALVESARYIPKAIPKLDGKKSK